MTTLTDSQQRHLEVLAKFYRLNPDPVMGRGNAGLNLAALRNLAEMGLVHTCHGLVTRTYRVFLTDEGKQVACGLCFDQGRAQGA